MPPVQERAPITEERRLAVAGWISNNIRPVERLLTVPEMRADPDSEAFQSWEQEFEDKEYQLDSWSCIWEARQRGEDKALLHLATGLGKTTVAVLDFLKFQEECKVAGLPEPRGLFLSHQDEINDQALQRFKRFMPDLETNKFATRQEELPNEGMTFATLQGMRNEHERFDPSHFDYIIVDEAHHAKADTYEDVVRYFTPKFKLGLTATPDRLDGRDIRELFGEAVYSKGLAEAIARGWLADVDYHIVFDDAVKEIMQGGFMPGTLKEMHELFSIRPRNEAIAKNVMEERHRIGLDAAKTIVFCESIEHAKEMAELLEGVTYHSDLDKDEKAAILSGFRSGGHQIICAVDMFNEGIDIPDARLIVFLRSTNSETIFQQQFGRGARRIKGVKEVVSVLDFVANIERVAMVRKLSESIQRHAKQAGQRGVSEEGVVFDNLEDEVESAVIGLKLHSQHSDFEFDKIAVDLLERWGILREAVKNTFSNLSDEELISLALSLNPGQPIRAKDMKELSDRRLFVHPSTIIDRFGSLVAFQRACGFEVRDTKSVASEEIITQALAIQPDRPLTVDDITVLSKEKRFVSTRTIRERFGSISAFQRACGFTLDREIVEARRDFKSVSDKEVVALAVMLSPDKALTTKRIQQLAKEGIFPSYSTINKRFGSLNAFQRACGLESRSSQYEKLGSRLNTRSMSDVDIIKLAREISVEKPLTTKDIVALSKAGQFVSLRTIQKRFKSVSAFLQLVDSHKDEL